MNSYLDSSALVKVYVNETGSIWVRHYCSDPRRNVILADIGRVEIAAAFAAKVRGQFISPEQYQHIQSRLSADVKRRYQLVPVSSQRIDEAIVLTTQNRLRGYDAVHLACALYLNRLLVQNDYPPLTFVSADQALVLAAQSEGLPTVNPTLMT